MNERTADSAVLALPEIMDLKAAGKLTSDFLALRKRELLVDASQVRRIGGQCLQVLLSARATWEFDGVGLRISTTSPAFVEGLQQLGISPEDFAGQENAR